MMADCSKLKRHDCALAFPDVSFECFNLRLEIGARAASN